MSPLEQAWLILKQYVPYAHEARSIMEESDPSLQALRRENEAAELEEYRQELMRQGRVPGTFEFPPGQYDYESLPPSPFDPNADMGYLAYAGRLPSRMERMPPPLPRPTR